MSDFLYNEEEGDKLIALCQAQLSRRACRVRGGRVAGSPAECEGQNRAQSLASLRLHSKGVELESLRG